jgi:hypothetical protein
VSFAGPLAGFALGGLVWVLSEALPMRQAGGLMGQAVRQLLWANVGWGLFNLLPLQPLDGGHLLASAVRARAGYRHERALHLIGIITAVGVVVLAVWWRTPWLGLFGLFFGAMNFEQLRRLPREPEAPRITPPRRRAPLPTDAATASETLQQLPGARRGREERRPSPSMLAPQAEEPESPTDARLVGALLLEGGLAALAVRPLSEAFHTAPGEDTGHALVVALLESGRDAELASLLSGPRARHLADDTLRLIQERAEVAGNTPLADRARALRAARAPKRNEPR